ncbi:MAG: hypothetical protein IJV34_07250 [Prevotella sp.]|nr:hypothetical protein [Prevotella sp.]
MQQNATYSTLEEIQQRRDQLSEAIEQEGEQIADQWHSLFKKDEDTSKGEYIVSIINNGIMAVDAFLLVRKLMRNYGSLFGLFQKKDKKKRKR